MIYYSHLTIGGGYMNLSKKHKILIQLLIGVFFICFTIFVYVTDHIDKENDHISLNEDKEITQIQSMEEDQTLSQEGIHVKPKIIVVDISGYVKKPAVYTLPEGSRIYQGIEAAGGLSENADTRNTNLAAPLCDGMKLYIPSKDEAVEQEKRTGEKPGSLYVGGNTAVTSKSENTKRTVNINTANSEELQQLTGVGPATAEKILTYRSEYGPFKTTEDLMNVSGIGEKTFEKLKDFISVE